ncbi:MAG: DUF1353 domain-containing protein [Microthrixaceae bacterium]
MPFRTPLSVRHEIGEEWRLLDPLVFEGRDDYFVMRKGFKTDFASIPRPVRWLFDTAGTNSEPGVLHDAVWRESKRSDGMTPRVDPWDADGLFRRALRESGATAISRALMWIAVRAAAIAAGRFGRSGPSLPVKVGQVTGMTAVGVVSVGAPTAVAVVGRIFYWLVEWIVAVPWYLFERAKGLTTNLPWPGGKRRERRDDPPREYLLVLPKDSPGGIALAAMLSPAGDQVVPDDALDALPSEALASAY